MAVLAALFLLASPHWFVALGADKDKKPEKEKKEKIEPWVELRTAHFIVSTDGGEKTAHRIADEFETLLLVFQTTMPNSRVTTGVPVRILAARDEKSFARMAPEFPADKRRDQPPGIFLAGPEKTYIGIRANASGRFRYTTIFQNYAHEILKLSYRSLPPWLEEGFSTVYGNLTFGDKGPRLERPDPDDLSVLFESPLLPIDLVLHADRTSPYYSPGNKQSVYFAESRVLVQFLITDPQFVASKSLEKYTSAVEGGTDSLQAARDAFGDLNQLQAKLDAFVKQVSAPPAELPVPEKDYGGPIRAQSVPESDARAADFLALRGRSEDAQDKLEESIMAQPALPEAEQSLGFILLKKDDLDEAQKHFDRAAQLDQKDALNFYGLGLVAMAKGGDAAVPAGAVEALEKSVALNGDFAPAWSSLAMLYSRKNETLPKALADARRAASLVPGTAAYKSQVAALQDQVSHPEAPARIAVRASPVPPPAGNTSNGNPPPPKAAADAGLRIERKTEPESKPSSAPAAAPVPAAPKTEPAAPAPPLFTPPPQVYSMVGTITDVKCTNAPQIQVTLKSQTIVMKLHADDFSQLSIKTAADAAATKNANCGSLRGRSARISYLFVTGKPWDAEMQSVEFRNLP